MKGVQYSWLIEHSRELGGKLINTHRYRTQNQLGTFNKILAGYGEDRAFVDAFHLDLCGTLSNKAITDFTPALPLVLKSKGRCLAVTVADQRRNIVLEQWPDFQKRAKKLFGKQAEDIYNQLAARQRCIPINKDAPAFIKPFDSTKATQREFGLLVELTELLHSHGLPWIPVVVERYVYVSRFQKRPFRMRTYFFRFESRKSRGGEISFARTWADSQLFFANGEEFVEVKVPAVGTTAIVPQQTQQGGVVRIQEFMNKAKDLAGPEVMAEFVQLLADSEQLGMIRLALGGVTKLNLTQPPAPVSGSPDAHVADQPRKRTKKNWEDLLIRDQIVWLIKALELRATSTNGHWHNGEWEKLLKEDFGHYDKKLGASLRAALARTSGKFREMFISRIEKEFGADAKPYLDRLAKIQ